MTLRFPKEFIIQQLSSSDDSVLITKNITANGTYSALNDEADGYSSVTVNVPSGMPITKDNVIRTCESEEHCYIPIKANGTQYGGTLVEGVYTGGSENYIALNQTAPLSTADSWEFRTKYTYKGGGNVKQIIGYTGTTDNATPYLAFQNGNYLTVALSSNGSSWDLTVDVTSLSANDGDTFYIKFGFTGTNYYVDYNTSGWDASFTNVSSLTSSTKVYCNVPFMLMNNGADTTGYYSSGSMDLKETSIIINGSTWWNGAIPAQIIF